ncbi:MAG: hypothetical protein JWQ89_2061 [Devosia sp.]|nr:hypothetical protein [Devosia sp.]
MLHGSTNPDIEVFEPRKSDDVNAFGDQTAVYAASDGIWPLYFAILDRQRYRMSLINGSFRSNPAWAARPAALPYAYALTDARHSSWTHGDRLDRRRDFARAVAGGHAGGDA